MSKYLMRSILSLIMVFTVIISGGVVSFAAADVTPPTIDIDSLKINPKNAVVGDIIKVSVVANDNVRVNNVILYYKTPVTQKSKAVELKYNLNEERFMSTIEIDNTFESGEWVLDHLYVYDTSSNSISVGADSYYTVKADLSAGNFNVEAGSEDESEIKYDYKITLDEILSLEYEANRNINWRLSDDSIASITDIGKSIFSIGSYQKIVSSCKIVPKKTGVVDVYAVDDNGYLLASAKVLITESTLKKFKITFDVNGGTSTHAPVEVKEGTSITLPIASREGYDFLGWSEVSNATTAEIDYTKPYFPQKDTILYAVWKEKEKFVLGDINADGHINSSDALLVLQHSVKKITLSGNEFTAADTNKDKQINSSDALKILQYSVGKIKEF